MPFETYDGGGGEQKAGDGVFLKARGGIVGHVMAEDDSECRRLRSRLEAG
jgi:hypothetical protein